MLQFAESSIGGAALAALRARAEGAAGAVQRGGTAACTVVVSQVSKILISKRRPTAQSMTAPGAMVGARQNSSHAFVMPPESQKEHLLVGVSVWFQILFL